MKNVKRVIALFLAVVMVFGLAACGSDSSPAAENTTENTTAASGDQSSAEENGKTEVKPVVDTAQIGKINLTAGDEGLNVKVVMGGGAEDETISLASGENVDLDALVPPDVAGCEFTGWYMDQALTEPVEESMVLTGNVTLYAGYRSNGTTFYDYQQGLPSNTEFILYSTEQITPETLDQYVKFDDVYNNELKISMEEIEAVPDVTEDTAVVDAQTLKALRAAVGKKLSAEKLEASRKVTGSFRYRLYAKNGFGLGQLYGFTVLQPEIVRFLTAGNISLVGEDAVQLNFSIESQKLNTQKENPNMIKLSAGDITGIKKTGDNQYTAVAGSSTTLKAGDVVFLPDSGKGVHYKVVSADGKNLTLEIASTSDIWQEYATTFDMSDIVDYSVELNDVDEQEIAKEITTSIGFAAYVDAVMDGVKQSPEVQEQLKHVSKEDYDHFMNMTAVDLGFGPEELQDEDTLSGKAETKYGSFSFDVNLNSQKIPYLKLEFECPEKEWTFGTEKDTGVQGSVKLSFTISETCNVSVYGKNIEKTDKYPSMTDDFYMVGALPDSTTEITFQATLELGKVDPKEDEKKHATALQSMEGDLGVKVKTSGTDTTEMDVTVAQQNYDLWVYVDKMQKLMKKNNDLYDMDLNYVNIIDRSGEKALGKITVNLGYVSVQFSLGFRFGVAAQVNLAAKLTYEYLGDCYVTNGKCTFGEEGKLTDITNYDDYKTGSRTLRSKFDLGIVLQGGFGYRAGAVVGINFSGFSMNDLLSVGLEAEAGPYVEFRGYFAFNYSKEKGQYYSTMLNKENEEYSYSTTSFSGGAKVQTGIYLNLSATVKLVYEWKIKALAQKFPLWDYEIGAYNSSANVCGGFVDSSETLNFTPSDTPGGYVLDLGSLAQKKTAVTMKTRSTVSDNNYPLEDAIGSTTSSGLLLLTGNTAKGSSSITTTQLKTDQYTVKIDSVTLSDSKMNDVRNFDGRIQSDVTTFTSAKDTEKYVKTFNDGSTNGMLVFNKQAPNMTVKAIVTATGQTNVFTAEEPVKTFYINYNKSGITVTKYHINFYDTDGNLLVTDAYPAGHKAVRFPEPGYTCERIAPISWGYYFTDSEEKLAAYRASRQKQTGNWATTAQLYWGYNDDGWDLSSAFWSDVPMTSGKDGNKVTAASVGTVNSDINVYLHMKYTKPLNAVWIVQYVDPDNPDKIFNSLVAKEVSYQYGQESTLPAQDPDLESLSREEWTSSGSHVLEECIGSKWDRPELLNDFHPVAYMAETERYSERDGIICYYYSWTDIGFTAIRRRVPKDYAMTVTATVSKTETSSTLDPNGGTFSDGTTTAKTVRGWKDDLVDLAVDGPVSPRYEKDPVTGYDMEFVLDGWILPDEDNKLVDTISYGQNGIAQWKKTGNFKFNLTLDANGGTYYGRWTTWEVTVDSTKTLAESTRYLLPDRVPDSYSTFDHWAWSDAADTSNISESTPGAELANHTGRLVAVWSRNVVTVTGWSGIFDGLPHTVTAVAGQKGATLEYSTDQTTWTKTAPTFTVVGTYTVYVRPVNEKSEIGQVATGTVSILMPNTFTVSGYRGTYDGKPHTVSATAPSTASTLEYSEDQKNWSSTVPAYTDAGTYTVYVQTVVGGISSGVIQSAAVVISPAQVTVTANNLQKTYGEADPAMTAYVSGMVNNEADTLITYQVSRAEGKNQGTYDITPSGEVSQGNYNVNFVSGTLTIKRKDVTVTANDKFITFGDPEPVLTATVTGMIAGEKESLLSYSIVRENGDEAGTYTISCNGSPDQGNYHVTFVNGKLTILAKDQVLVLIAGNQDTVVYDGQPHTVTGFIYTATCNGVDVTNSYTRDSFTFSGNDTVTAKNVGKVSMNLDAVQFKNTSKNYSNVTFYVNDSAHTGANDGYIEIKPLDVTATIQGNTATNTFDGETHSVSGYTMTPSSSLYKDTDITCSSTATAARRDVGTTAMNLTAASFKNNNSNFNVTFNVTDGGQTITEDPNAVVVTITGNSNTSPYDGKVHTITGYTVSSNKPDYLESDFTFSGTATASGTQAGTTYMGLSANQFTNISTKYTKVTFVITDGYQKITQNPFTVTYTLDSDASTSNSEVMITTKGNTPSVKGIGLEGEEGMMSGEESVVYKNVTELTDTSLPVVWNYNTETEALTEISSKSYIKYKYNNTLYTLSGLKALSFEGNSVEITVVPSIVEIKFVSGMDSSYSLASVSRRIGTYGYDAGYDIFAGTSLVDYSDAPAYLPRLTSDANEIPDGDYTRLRYAYGTLTGLTKDEMLAGSRTFDADTTVTITAVPAETTPTTTP